MKSVNCYLTWQGTDCTLGSANFLCKGPDSKEFQLFGPYSLCLTRALQLHLSQHESSHRHYINKWARLYFNKTFCSKKKTTSWIWPMDCSLLILAIYRNTMYRKFQILHKLWGQIAHIKNLYLYSYILCLLLSKSSELPFEDLIIDTEIFQFHF